MKKIVVFIVGGIITFLLACLLPWFIFPVLNDRKAESINQELLKAKLPSDTMIVESITECGNTSGTGDYTEIMTVLLIKTNLREKQIVQLFCGKSGEDYRKQIIKVDSENKQTWGMSMLNIKFERLKGISEYDGYYIYEQIDFPVSSFFDIRGT